MIFLTKIYRKKNFAFAIGFSLSIKSLMFLLNSTIHLLYNDLYYFLFFSIIILIVSIAGTISIFFKKIYFIKKVN
jgi:hypothetical protein